ncbi:MAG: prepilin peptidase [Phycisphaerales bacterium]|nr:prepilin peptidase [Phycisphaerales bacterium]
METYEVYMLVFAILQIAFMFALGSCVGSLINVLVYRMPRGLSVVSPPSRCPNCQTRLTWRENIPVFGWIFLRGRCRFCRVKISAEYPIVEAFVGGLFVLVFALWYLLPTEWRLGGSITIHSLRPEWASSGLSHTWPIFTVILILLSSLTAMTLVDAKTSMIPLPLAWAPAIAAILFHPVHAAWIQHKYGRLPRLADGWAWSMATPGPDGWRLIGLAIGGTVGLLISNILLHRGLIRRSWSDYDQWENAHLSAAPRTPAVDAVLQPAPEIDQEMSIPAASDPPLPTLPTAMDVPADVPPAAPAGPNAQQPAAAGDQASPSDLWLEYPHARREVLKEAIFLAPVIGLGLLGSAIAVWLAGPWHFDMARQVVVPTHHAPLWLDVLAGVLAGYLIGGGVVWIVRILGTLGFGREAMGLGDVHLLAAIGACIGWVDATLAFFGAAFVGLLYAMLSAFFKGFRRAMPYGPHIAVAAALIIILKPGIEAFLTLLMKADPPIDLP